MNNTIVLTGGGTAGHIMPNLALVPLLKKRFINIYYIGAQDSLEQKLCQKHNITFFAIPVCKLNRSLTFSNFKIPFTLSKSIAECKRILTKLQPDVVFSKGGFVGLPVCLASKKLNIPYFIHESDYTLGLANKLCKNKAQIVFTSFSDTAKKRKNFMCSGSCIRQELFSALPAEIKKGPSKPTILVMGGSLGSKNINQALLAALPEIIKKYNVIHITGKHTIEFSHPHYTQLEFYEKIGSLFSACDIVVSRAGSNTIFELLALQKPMLLIPLSKKASRGDQLLNTDYFLRHGYCKALFEEKLTPQNLISKIDSTYADREKLISKMKMCSQKNATNTIADCITEFVTKKAK